jgi:hypothetical protein
MLRRTRLLEVSGTTLDVSYGTWSLYPKDENMIRGTRLCVSYVTWPLNPIDESMFGGTTQNVSDDHGHNIK